MSNKALANLASLTTKKPPQPFYRCRKSGKKLQHRYLLTSDERGSIISAKGLGDSGLLLYEYYLHMAGWDNEPITDDGIAKYFSWSTRKARRYRTELEKQGWISTRNFSFTSKRGGKGVVYFIGKDMVRSASSMPMKSLFTP